MVDKQKPQYNPVNERMKYKYRQHLRRIGQRDEKTINASLKHLRDFEIYIDFAGFEIYDADIADKYVRSLFGKELSLSYIMDNVRAIKEFLKWLERQKGYRSKIDYNQIEYLNISRNQRNTAKAKEYKPSYKFQQILQTIRAMPKTTDREKRDVAVISLQAMCAFRVGELRTIKSLGLYHLISPYVD